MDESPIARGVIKVEGDTSGLDATIAKAGKTLDTLGQKGAAAGKQVAQGLKEASNGAKTGADQIDAAGQRVLRSLEREAAQVGKTRSEYLAWLAAQRGISTQAEPFIAKIREAEAALNNNANSLTKNGLTQKQYQQALRGTSAQLTDIIVSLQGGQRPLDVLLQQGGQLRDMFGGIAPAARALGGAVLGLINPFTLTAGAVALLAYAYSQGASESQKFKNALITSGNLVGQTSDSLQQMAERVADVSKTTQSEASDILTQLVQSGQISGRALETAASGAAAATKVLGIETKDAVSQFESLAKDPVNAIQALNDKYHFLTAATYEQIKALAEQGDKQGAAKAAIDAYSDAMNGRTPQILQNLGYIESAWNKIVKGSKAAINELFNIGRDTTLQDRIDQIQKQIKNNEALRARGARSGVGESETAQLQAQLNALIQEQESGDIAAVAKSTQQRQQDALIAWANNNDKYLTQVAKVEKEHAQNVKQIEQMAKSAGVSAESLQTRLDSENARYKKALESATSGDASKATRIDKANLSLDVERIQSERDKLLSIYSTSEKVMESMRQAGLLGDKEYYEAKYGYIVLESDARQKALQDEIARYQQEKLSGADALEIQKKIADAQGKLDQERIESSTKLITLEMQESAAVRAKAASLLSARQAAQDYLDTTNRAYERDVQTAWMGNSARQYASGVSQVEERYQQLRQNLANQRAMAQMQAGGTLTAEVRKQYDAQLAIIDEFQQKALESYDTYWQALKAGEANWRNGANKAIADYLDDVANAAKRTQDVISSSLTGLTDSITAAMLGDTDSFKNLGNTIGKKILSGLVDQNFTKGIAQLLQSQFSDKDSIFSGIFGKLMGGTGDSSAAAITGLATSSSAVATANGALATSSSAATAALTALTSALSAATAAAYANAGASGVGSSLSIANAVGSAGGDALGEFISQMGWASGGYTGAGGKYQPAGVVHKGEYVINAASTKRLGTAFLGRLNGYAEGGYVGGAPSPLMPNITINNTMSDQAEVSAKPRMNNGQIELEVIVQRVMASDARRNGPITQGMAQTFGIQRSAF